MCYLTMQVQATMLEAGLKFLLVCCTCSALALPHATLRHCLPIQVQATASEPGLKFLLVW